jgi:drug/metabolite transporter (DMT)-like permease
VSRIPLKLALGLAIAIGLDTAVQLLWKTAVGRLPEGLGLVDTALAAAHQPVFLITGLLLISQTVNWLTVLDHADLSFAQPITALSYVSVLLLSATLLGENIGRLQILGVGCILLGVWFISRSGPLSRPPGGLEP